MLTAGRRTFVNSSPLSHVLWIYFATLPTSGLETMLLYRFPLHGFAFWRHCDQWRRKSVRKKILYLCHRKSWNISLNQEKRGRTLGGKIWIFYREKNIITLYYNPSIWAFAIGEHHKEGERASFNVMSCMKMSTTRILRDFIYLYTLHPHG